MKCGENIVESNWKWARPPAKFEAMCLACAKAVIAEYIGDKPMVEHDGKYCRDCQTLGRQTAAHRLIGRTLVCDAHFRQRMGLPQLTPLIRRPTCVGCQQQGKHVPATKTVNGMNMCDEHAGAAAIDEPEDLLGPEVETEKKETRKMARKKDIDWNEVQRKRNEGSTTTELADEFGCSVATVCNHTKKAPSGRLEAIADRAKRPKGNNGAGYRKTAGTTTLADTIAELTTKRDKLNVAIETLQGLDA
jgi:hypothetical protein